MIFLTSDTHFNHANIIRYCKRPWLSVDDMNMALIDRWNAVVGHDDTIFHLGDFSLGGYDGIGEIFELLNGQKHLIRGNHDGTKVLGLGWQTIEQFRHMAHGGDPLGITLIHDPGKVRHKGRPGLILHGHLHGDPDSHPFERIPHATYVDVGVDCWDYAPVPLARLVA